MSATKRKASKNKTEKSLRKKIAQLKASVVVPFLIAPMFDAVFCTNYSFMHGKVLSSLVHNVDCHHHFSRVEREEERGREQKNAILYFFICTSFAFLSLPTSLKY